MNFSTVEYTKKFDINQLAAIRIISSSKRNTGKNSGIFPITVPKYGTKIWIRTIITKIARFLGASAKTRSIEFL